MATNKEQEIIEKDVQQVLDAKQDLESLEQELMENPKFRQFIEMQKSFQEQSTTIWKNVELTMINNDIKSIKGEWGSVTIVEKTGFDIIPEELPIKFMKRVPDVKKIGDTYKLEGKLPKGATVRNTKYLMKRFK